MTTNDRVENPSRTPDRTTTEQHDCEKTLTKKYGWLTSGLWRDGAVVTCSCGRKYEHVCDEAEGCFWEPMAQVVEL